MLELIKFIFSTVGLTLIITHSKLFKPFRGLCDKIHKKLGNYVKCSQCVGFLSGIIIYLLQNVQLLLIYKYLTVFLFYKFYFELVIYGFIGSFVSYVIYLLLCPLIKKYD